MSKLTSLWGRVLIRYITLQKLQLIDKNNSEISVLRQIKHLKSNKAAGPDGISPKLLKSASHAVSPLLNLASNFKLDILPSTVGTAVAESFPIMF